MVKIKHCETIGDKGGVTTFGVSHKKPGYWGTAGRSRWDSERLALTAKSQEGTSYLIWNAIFWYAA